jgi:GntR family transcriptional regulator, transcriptional repressor for pyruvate dehydrogenase complex
MTKPPLVLVQSVVARIACAQRTWHDLRVLRDSVERACGLPFDIGWERKAAAHAEFYCLLADATGTPVYALLARCVSGSMRDMIVAAGPSAEGNIIASHRRLLGHLRARDADGAAWEMEDHLAQLAQVSGLLAVAGPGIAHAPEAIQHG